MVTVDASVDIEQSTLPVLAIVGSTATGKSDLAIDVALQLDGEIVNADSMQVYRGMDIGTAKLPIEERRGVVHHLLDVWDVTQSANVAEYQLLARAAIADIRSRGKLPIVVGGSGLYVRAVFDDLDFPGTDAEIRRDVQQQADALGTPAMYEKLRALDPDAAASILPTNSRRIIRALEVIELTGQPFTASLPQPVAVIQSVHVGLAVERAVLDERINSRVDRMWEQGLVGEVTELAQQGLRQGITARRALGYAQVLDFLDGNCDEAAAREATKSSTRKFARRQQSWFRRDASVVWLDAAGDGLLEAALACYRAGAAAVSAGA